MKRAVKALIVVGVCSVVVVHILDGRLNRKEAVPSLDYMDIGQCPVTTLSVDKLADKYKAIVINRYLEDKGSPAYGTGGVWVECEKRYSIPASLVMAIFGQESTWGTNGNFSKENHNGWGMHAESGYENKGLCRYWPDWRTGVEGAFDFLNRNFSGITTAEGLARKGYCGGDSDSWLRAVKSIQDNIVW